MEGCGATGGVVYVAMFTSQANQSLPEFETL
jgi:hypothetical protein